MIRSYEVQSPTDDPKTLVFVSYLRDKLRPVDSIHITITDGTQNGSAETFLTWSQFRELIDELSHMKHSLARQIQEDDDE